MAGVPVSVVAKDGYPCARLLHWRPLPVPPSVAEGVDRSSSAGTGPLHSHQLEARRETSGYRIFQWTGGHKVK